jgi:hypothetical protein
LSNLTATIARYISGLVWSWQSSFQELYLFYIVVITYCSIYILSSCQRICFYQLLWTQSGYSLWWVLFDHLSTYPDTYLDNTGANDLQIRSYILVQVILWSCFNSLVIIYCKYLILMLNLSATMNPVKLFCVVNLVSLA